MEIIILLIVAVIVILIPFIGGLLGIAANMRVKSLQASISSMKKQLQALQARFSDSPGPRPPVQEPSVDEPFIDCSTLQAAEQPVVKQTPEPQPLAMHNFTPLEDLGIISPLPMQAESTPPPLPPLPQTTPAAVTAEPAKKPAGKSSLEQLEARIGRQWIAWVGAVVLFFSAAFFLKHAFDNSWIGPLGQVIICSLVGLAVLFFGSRSIAKGWRALGQSLMGLGLAILYATLFAAFAVYDPPVISQTTAFALMVVVNIAGMALAIKHDALTIAFLAVLGGVLTPVLVSSGHDSRDVLFAYLLLLNLGVVGVAFFRKWRLLNTLAMAGSFILYAGWHFKFYDSPAMVPALLWLGAFFMVFLSLPYLYNLVHKENLKIEQYIMALANITFTSGFVWYMMQDSHRFAMAYISLGLAGAYLATGLVIRKRLQKDAAALCGAVALAVVFLTLAVPLRLRGHGIMLTWVVEAPVLAYLGYRFRYLPLRLFAGAVLIIAVGRLFIAPDHWPLHAGGYNPIFNLQFLSAMAVPTAAAMFAIIHHRFKERSNHLDTVIMFTSALGGGLLTLILLQSELCVWLRSAMGNQTALNVSTILLVAGALAYLLAGRWVRKTATAWVWAVGTCVLAMGTLMGIMAFAQNSIPGQWLFINGRFGVNLLVLTALFFYCWVIRHMTTANKDNAAACSEPYLFIALAGLAALLSFEVYNHCINTIADTTIAQQTGLKFLVLIWGVYAIALGLFGILLRGLKTRKPLVIRIWGFGTFILGLAVIIGGVLMIHKPNPGQWLFINGRFAVDLLVIAAVFFYCWLIRHMPADSEDSAVSYSSPYLFIGLAGLIALLSVEVYSHCINTIADVTIAQQTGRKFLVLLWGVYAIALGLFGILLGGLKTRKPVVIRIWGFGTFILGLAAIMGGVLLTHKPNPDQLLFINGRFAVDLLVIAAAIFYCWLIRHMPADSEDSAVSHSAPYLFASIAGLIALLSVEVYSHCINTIADAAIAQQAGQKSLVLVWSSSALGLLLLGKLLGGLKPLKPIATGVWGVGTIVLGLAAIMGGVLLAQKPIPGQWLFINGRFGVILLVLAAVFCYSWVIRQKLTAKNSRAISHAAPYFVFGIAGMLILMSIEVYSHSINAISDETIARRTGQMAITLVWSVYAISLLFVGFWRRWRAVRLSGLALFGMAAVKIAAVDLMHLKDIYRIITFMVLGLLMLGASYLYHKLEKRLVNPQSDPPPIEDEKDEDII